VHLAHSPDAAPSDFFLFACLKREMAGITANSPADILSEIPRIFQEISKETLVAVYEEWITQYCFQFVMNSGRIQSPKVEATLAFRIPSCRNNIPSFHSSS
jgi:hypothetical protein